MTASTGKGLIIIIYFITKGGMRNGMEYAMEYGTEYGTTHL